MINASHNRKSDGLRKTAIFLSRLDHKKAEILLSKMDKKIARGLRQVMSELGRIDEEEVQEALGQFVRQSKEGMISRGVDRFLQESPTYGPPHQGILRKQPVLDEFPRYDDTNETSSPLKCADRKPNEETRISRMVREGKFDDRKSEGDQPIRPVSHGESETEPFESLHHTEAENLAAAMSEERPQTIALVLAHLPPEQAGEVLIGFSSCMQAEIVRRLTSLEEIDCEVLKEVEEALQSRLTHSLKTRHRRAKGQQVVREILSHADQRVQMQIIANLDKYDHALAEQFMGKRLDFEDLLRFDDSTMDVLLRSVDLRILILAMVGAPPSMIERILSRFPAAQHKKLKRQLNHLGPIQLSDVEESRKMLAREAIQLAAQGKIRVDHYSKERRKGQPPSKHLEYAV